VTQRSIRSPSPDGFVETYSLGWNSWAFFSRHTVLGGRFVFGVGLVGLLGTLGPVKGFFPKPHTSWFQKHQESGGRVTGGPTRVDCGGGMCVVFSRSQPTNSEKKPKPYLFKKKQNPQPLFGLTTKELDPGVFGL